LAHMLAKEQLLVVDHTLVEEVQVPVLVGVVEEVSLVLDKLAVPQHSWAGHQQPLQPPLQNRWLQPEWSLEKGHYHCSHHYSHESIQHPRNS